MTIKITCEDAVWYILPIIRKEFAKNLIKDHGLTQRKAAEKLGIHESAVSQYLSKKRAKTKPLTPDLIDEIKQSTKLIVDGDTDIMKKEVCRVCHLIQSKVFNFKE